MLSKRLSRAEVERGAELIARLVEPAARSAWMAASQNADGVLQQTSDEDVPCRAGEVRLRAALRGFLAFRVGEPDNTLH